LKTEIGGNSKHRKYVFERYVEALSLLMIGTSFGGYFDFQLEEKI